MYGVGAHVGKTVSNHRLGRDSSDESVGSTRSEPLLDDQPSPGHRNLSSLAHVSSVQPAPIPSLQAASSELLEDRPEAGAPPASPRSGQRCSCSAKI